MPKTFTIEEMEKIRKELLSAGKEMFTKWGLKKTSIDDLVLKVGIAKGSFYRFFSSKEMLYLEVMEEEEKTIRSSMEKIYLEGKSLNQEYIFQFFSGIVTYIEDNPIFLKMFDENALDQVMRKIPPERLEKHKQNDNDWSVHLFKNWKKQGYLNDIDESIFAALLRTIFILFTQKKAIGDEQFKPVLNLLFKYISKGIISNKQGDSND